MNLQENIEEIQTAYSINRQMTDIASEFEIFKFLLGDQARYCDFARFLHFWHANEADLPCVIDAFLHINSYTNTNAAVQAARNLFAAQEMIVKHDFSDEIVEFIDGDRNIFDKFQKNYHFSKKKLLSHPGKYSKDAFLVAFPSDKLFVKPTDNLEKAQHEVDAYKIASKMGLSEYLLPTCIASIKKGLEKTKTVVVTAILPYDAISLEQLEKSRPGAGDGIIKNLVDKGVAHKLALFDYLISNIDRHKNNIFVNGNKIYLIDHGEAFSIKKSVGFIPGYLRLSSYKTDRRLPLSKSDAEFKEWLKKLDFSDSYLTTDVIVSILKESSPSEAINKMWDRYYEKV